MAEVLNCRVDKLPTKYLGINIGASLRRIVDWNYLLEKVRKKISGWNHRNISFGGRLTLVRSILSSIPIYQMSFSIVPKAVLSKIRSVMCNFLWGGGGAGHKIIWVKWDDICKHYNQGGLGLKNLAWFNYALMGKWLWRFLVSKDELWARVVRARHGEVEWDEGGFRATGNSRARTGWWNYVMRLSLGEGGKWMRDNLFLKLGRGDKILFWHHSWAGAFKLKTAFPRLYRLSSNQDGSISEMGSWVEGRWVWNVGWRRDLLERERDQANILYNTISRIGLSAGLDDEWRWNPLKPGMYSVKAAYSAQSVAVHHRAGVEEDGTMAAIWKAPAPAKVITTAWRILKGRMASCENLRKRNVVLNSEELLCVSCKSQEETANHILFSCHGSTVIWQGILRWLGLQGVLHQSAKEHLLMFTNLGKLIDKKFMTGIWMATAWCIWKWRNDCKFNKKVWESPKILSEIKARLWSWRLAFSNSSPNTDFKGWFTADNLLEVV